ncbi:hypothetical protein BJ912DRAFT_95582 [Pholiota molesta]|nr:hypothetical protein BJ912DRAFT_95582 [Pholiota molesta]
MSVITYDDRDTIISYSSGWTRGGNTADFDGTSTFTTTNGSTATITFTGVQISVYGTIPVVTPKTTSSYSIDGGPPTLFTAPFQIQGSGTPNTYFFQQLYYQSPILTPNTPHTLVVNYAVVSGTQFFLDFMKVVSANSTSTTSTATSEATTSPTVNKSSPPPTGIIVGAVIGGLAVVLLGIGFCFLLRVRMRRRNRPISTAPTLNPFREFLSNLFRRINF